MDIVERLRYVASSESMERRWPRMCGEAANYIEELRMALVQYQDDLNYPPTKDSLARRLEMIDNLMVRK